MFIWAHRKVAGLVFEVSSAQSAPPPIRNAGLFYYIPQAALGSIIITAVVPMVDYEAVIDMWRVNKLDLLPFAVSFFGSLFLGIEYGVLSAVGLNILYLLFLTAR